MVLHDHHDELDILCTAVTSSWAIVR